MNDKHLDCVVIGYNELPFERYENFLRNYGEDSEAYRDLKFSFVNLGFPGETDETVAETIDFIRETKPDYYRAQMWYCEPGTPIQNERLKFDIKGEGFVWSHATMDSLEAMDHIDRMFLTLDQSLWLPQWSFDFWIVPYLLGKGISLAQFRDFMTQSHKLLSLERLHPSLSKKRTGCSRSTCTISKRWLEIGEVFLRLPQWFQLPPT